MSIKKHSMGKLFLFMFSVLLILFSLSIPIAYFDAACARHGKEIQFPIYMAMRGMRFAGVILLGWMLRKKYRAALAEKDSTCKYVMAAVVLCIFIGILPFLHNLWNQIYSTVFSRILFVPSVSSARLFLAVLWEQFFAGDLFWCILLCTSIIFMPQNMLFRKNGM